VKFEVLENIVAEPVAVCAPQSMSPNFAISVLNSYLSPLRTPEAVATFAVFRI